MSIVIGDIHGKFRELYDNLERIKPTLYGRDIFALGDVNVGFNPEFEKKILWPTLSKFLDEVKAMFYIIRGNHDNPEWFDGMHNYQRIKFLEDYSIVKSFDIEHNPINILVLGGGISINRTSRNFKEGENWFKDENFILDKKLLKSMRNINVVLSHNCPWFCQPNGINMLIQDWAQQDPTLPDDIINERNEFTDAFTILQSKNKLKRWYYGHMHQSLKFRHNDVEFQCLNELEIDEILI